jgi:hypothetical protein
MCCQGRKSRTTWPRIGVRPRPPPTMTVKPTSPSCCLEVQADVVEPGDGAVFAGAGYGDLELARQEGEFRVEGAPLAQDLGQRARVDDLVGGDAGELVGGDVADAVARGLDGVHLDFGQLGQDVGHVLDLRPVELQVVARREMAVAAVVGAGDMGQLAQLGGESACRRARRCGTSARGAGCRGRSAGAAGGIRRRSVRPPSSGGPGRGTGRRAR